MDYFQGQIDILKKMLTPRFELTQTEDEVLVVIHAPYANIKDTEVHVEECDFRFFSNPYYLRYYN